MKPALPERILIVLDLDETLIHATTEEKFGEIDFSVGPYGVYIRPGLQPFLELLREHFRVAVWSSASDDYVTTVASHLFPAGYPLEFIWGRSRCTLRRDTKEVELYGHTDANSHLHYTKMLRKVKDRGYVQSLERLLIIDDTPTKVRNAYGNAIYPRVFDGSPDDEELALLGRYLLIIKDVENVRSIEKREWREQIDI